MSQSIAQSEVGKNAEISRSIKDRAKLFARFAQLGNRARDNHSWFLAAIYYEEALRIDPDKPAYWVQFGHALKESGERGRAEDAYWTALRLDPTNADTFLQLGHLLKIQGQHEDALGAYARAMELAPGDMGVSKEFANLQSSHEKEQALKAARGRETARKNQ